MRGYVYHKCNIENMNKLFFIEWKRSHWKNKTRIK